MPALAPATARRKRIFVVDDHPVMREGLRDLIRSQASWEVCGEAEDAPDAMAAMQLDPPDVAIVDIALKSGNGLDLIKDLKLRCPDTISLAISMHDESLYAEQAIRAGARGYIMKQEGGGKLIEGIRRVLDGGTSVSPRVMARILEVLNRRGALPSLDNLSDQELEVFQLVGAGFNSRQIAAKLRISVKSVEAERARLLGKLNLATTAELFRCAVRWVDAQSAI